MQRSVAACEDARGEKEKLQDGTMRDEVDRLRRTCEGASSVEMPFLQQESCDTSFGLSGPTGKGSLTSNRCDGESQRWSRLELPLLPNTEERRFLIRQKWWRFNFIRFNPGVTGVRRSDRQDATGRRDHTIARRLKFSKFLQVGRVDMKTIQHYHIFDLHGSTEPCKDVFDSTCQRLWS